MSVLAWEHFFVAKASWDAGAKLDSHAGAWEPEKITEFLRNKGIRFNAMITGDCTQPDDWNKLPSAD